MSDGARRTSGTPAHRAGVLAVAVALGTVGMVGCTGDDSESSPTTSTRPAPPPTTVVDEPAVDAGLAYARAFADSAVLSSDVAVGDAVHYLDHRRLSAEILGLELALLPGADAHRLCVDGRCSDLADLVAEPATGRVSTGSVDGVPLAGRITGSGLITDDDGVVAQTRTAYVTTAGQLAVTIEVSNTTDAGVELFGFAAVLRPAGGSSGLETVGSWGEPVVPPGGTTVLLVAFDTDVLGGRIGLRGLTDAGLDVELDVVVPSG